MLGLLKKFSRPKLIIVLNLLAVLLLYLYIYTNCNHSESKKFVNTTPIRQNRIQTHDPNRLSFGDNITGYAYNIVPNIVHYVLFGTNQIQFSHYISILSVIFNQKPDKIYIHCDCNRLNGTYYQLLKKKIPSSKTRFILAIIRKPISIYGIPLSKQYMNWHSSDITRIKTLMQFGGIYLDQDVYVVKSLDVFRKYEMTLNWDDGQYLGNQVLIAHKDSRFLKLYLESYRKYDPKKWYYNAGDYPTQSILYSKPYLVHRVKKQFGVDGPVVCPKLYLQYYPKWREEFYTIHLVMQGNDLSHKNWCFGKKYPAVTRFNETTAVMLNNTFGEMTRLLFKNL